jgi:uncharacterized caspase-like protein
MSGKHCRTPVIKRDEPSSRLIAARSVLASMIVAGAMLVVTSVASLAQTRVALVIGNSRYANIAALSNPESDATAMAATLEKLGFAVTSVLDADFNGFRKALLQFDSAAIGADIAVVYFAGHGMEVGGENWLTPVDAVLQTDGDIDKEAISLRSVLHAVSNAARLGLVILDACRNNPFAVKMQRISQSRAVERGLVRVEPQKNILVAYAARDGTTSQDGAGRHSPFTAALLNNIATPGQEINFLFRRVRDEVLTETAGTQQPFVYGSLSREKIYLAPSQTPDSKPAAVVASSGTTESAELITDCDKLAASPGDPSRPRGAPGIDLTEIKVDAAMPACEAARRDHPAVIRFTFQAGRVAEAAKSFDRARALYEEAATTGYAPAMNNLGLLWAGGALGSHDYGLARRWLEKAVLQGNIPALSNLGFLYQAGKGAPADYGAARELYERAAAAGDSTGMNNLGTLYEFGRNVPRDLDAARQWYEKSATLGNPLGMRNLGDLYASGKGVLKNLEEARRWYVLSAAKGDDKARQKLDELGELR